MLYVIHGTDSQKNRDKMHILVGMLHKRKPDAELFRVDEETFMLSEFEGLVFGQGLFEAKYIVVLDHVFVKAEAKEKVLNLIKSIGASDNVFILLEDAIDVPTKKKLEKIAQKTEEHSKKKETKEFNVFALTDAIGARNKKRAWLLYREAIEEGKKPEELHGIITWQIKSILLAKTSKNAKESGLKPFVFQKAKAKAEKFELVELRAMIEQFTRMAIESREGKDLETEIERFVLSI